MRTYEDLGDGRPLLFDGMSIPKDTANRHYAEALAMVATNEAEIVPYVPPPEPVPASVTRFQARAALLQAGLLDAATAAVEASGDAFTKLAWAEASEWRRESALVVGMATAIGLTSDQIDDLFRAAAQITA